MKKMISAIIVVVIMLTFAVPASAAKYWTLEALASGVKGTPTINGKASSGEWDKAPEIDLGINNEITKKLGDVYGEWVTTKDPTDFDSKVKIMWDDKYLYIYEKRVDNKMNNFSREPWGTDGMIVFLQVGETGSALNPEGWGYQIYYVPDQYISIRICNAKKQKTEKAAAPLGTKAGATITETGYEFELAIPWTMFSEQVTNFKGPKIGDILGLNFMPCDNDNDYNKPCYSEKFLWVMQVIQQDVPGGIDYGGWGTLWLVDKYVAGAVPVTSTDVSTTPSTIPSTTTSTIPSSQVQSSESDTSNVNTSEVDVLEVAEVFAEKVNALTAINNASAVENDASSNVSANTAANKSGYIELIIAVIALVLVLGGGSAVMCIKKKIS